MLLVSDKVEQMIYFPPEYHDRSEEASINAQVKIFETIPNRRSKHHQHENRKKISRRKPKLFLKILLHTFTFQKFSPEKIEYVSHDEYDSLLFYQTEFRAEYLRTLTKSKKEQESKCPFDKENS